MDLLGGAISIVLLLSIVIFVGLEREIPDMMSAAFAGSMGWVFRGGAQAANGYLNNRKGGSNASS